MLRLWRWFYAKRSAESSPGETRPGEAAGMRHLPETIQPCDDPEAPPDASYRREAERVQCLPEKVHDQEAVEAAHAEPHEGETARLLGVR